MKRVRLLMFVAGLCGLVVSSPLLAKSPYGGKGPSHGHEERRLSLDGAVSRIREREKGRVLSADEEYDNGDSVYRIRVLTDDGKVKRLRVDPRSGRTIP